jgi:uncharacterized protein (TIGR02118 family)
MYKLVILIPDAGSNPEFYEHWPVFLRQAEEIPGLVREATSHTLTHVFGQPGYDMIHELFFNSKHELEKGLDSPKGRQAANSLHKITHGQVVIFVADHKEDSIENLRKHRPAQGPHEPQQP